MGGNLALLAHEFDFPPPKKSQAVKYHMLGDGHHQTRFQRRSCTHCHAWSWHYFNIFIYVERNIYYYSQIRSKENKPAWIHVKVNKHIILAISRSRSCQRKLFLLFWGLKVSVFSLQMNMVMCTHLLCIQGFHFFFF